MEFGTGVVKITPAHDPNDYEVGRRHDLPILKVMNDDATMTAACGKYAGMERYEARKAIVKDLEEQGYLLKVEDHTHNVGTCYRCGTTVEPMVSKQWFVKMEPLAKPAIDVVRNGQIKLIPERMDKTYYNWMENIKRLVYLPSAVVGSSHPRRTTAKAAERSSLPRKLRLFVRSAAAPTCIRMRTPWTPGSARHCGRSLLWVGQTTPRSSNTSTRPAPWSPAMTSSSSGSQNDFSGLEHMGDIPFNTVLFHGLVRDAQGRKMSKSLGNGIDPLEIIDQYGADALRFTLATGNTPGNDMRFSDEKVIASRNFANKIWNASRFVLMNLKDEQMDLALPLDQLAIEDKWVLTKYNTLVKEVTDNLEKFELGICGQQAVRFYLGCFLRLVC